MKGKEQKKTIGHTSEPFRLSKPFASSAEFDDSRIGQVTKYLTTLTEKFMHLFRGLHDTVRYREIVEKENERVREDTERIVKERQETENEFFQKYDALKRMSSFGDKTHSKDSEFDEINQESQTERDRGGPEDKLFEARSDVSILQERYRDLEAEFMQACEYNLELEANMREMEYEIENFRKKIVSESNRNEIITKQMDEIVRGKERAKGKSSLQNEEVRALEKHIKTVQDDCLSVEKEGKGIVNEYRSLVRKVAEATKQCEETERAIEKKYDELVSKNQRLEVLMRNHNSLGTTMSAATKMLAQFDQNLREHTIISRLNDNLRLALETVGIKPYQSQESGRRTTGTPSYLRQSIPPSAESRKTEPRRIFFEQDEMIGQRKTVLEEEKRRVQEHSIQTKLLSDHKDRLKRSLLNDLEEREFRKKEQEIRIAEMERRLENARIALEREQKEKLRVSNELEGCNSQLGNLELDFKSLSDRVAYNRSLTKLTHYSHLLQRSPTNRSAEEERYRPQMRTPTLTSKNEFKHSDLLAMARSTADVSKGEIEELLNLRPAILDKETLGRLKAGN
eukprot:TRINITY_DN6956_c0_g1_i1.p1 TRINITY_DN6956_c0_g1~~TRINITY_DN6956_c0_g1_i1.p1  ORF type:complete len:567 (-),score=119.35 TRINITY_DN6956_c0_g1_i1:57-1757(-)